MNNYCKIKENLVYNKINYHKQIVLLKNKINKINNLKQSKN